MLFEVLFLFFQIIWKEIGSLLVHKFRKKPPQASLGKLNFYVGGEIIFPENNGKITGKLLTLV